MVRKIGREVLKVNKATMSVIASYASARDAEIENGLAPGNVSRQARNKAVPTGMHMYRYADSYDQNESLDGKFNRPVLAEDCKTGKRVVFADSTTMAKALFMSYGNVQECLSKGCLLGGQLKLSYYR